MNRLLLCGAVLGLISVIMGALSDHAFDLTPEKAESLETAIRYNMVYAALIIALAIAPTERRLHIPGLVFALGAFLFSFSIYMALITNILQFTYIAPLGGLTIMIGWITLIYIVISFKV